MTMLDIAVDKINKNSFLSGIFPNMPENFLPDVIAQKRLSVFR